MSLYSIPFFARFEEATGYPSGYKPHGYLFVATSQAHLDYLRTNQARQIELGLRGVSLLTREDVVAMAPFLRSDDIVGGSFCGTDGFVDPNSVMVGFSSCAVDRGAALWRSVNVTGVATAGGKVTGVMTSRGEVSTNVVVNAAGAWSPQVAAMAGVPLPVEPLRRMLVPTEPLPGFPDKLPMVIDMSTGFHFRPEGAGLLLAWADATETPGYKLNVDPEFIEKILTRAVDRVPAFADLEVNPKRTWAGLYEMSPDHHAILGPTPLQGFYVATGFSGHGVMHSPATGRVMAEWILEGRPRTIDAEPLAYSRFAEGRLIEETAVL